jgi:hypothetical protein
MGSKIWSLLFTAVTLSGCGGGGDSGSADEGQDSQAHPFLVWAGSSSGDRVIDANNDAFAFFADTGCLFNFQTGRENRDFCLTSGQSTAQYGRLFMRIVNGRSVVGSCIAALVEESTARFIDIQIDTFGREIVIVTTVQPEPCF